MSLSPESIERYQRQILLAPIGGAGQERIEAARLLLHGTAPLAATYLTAAGCGTLLVASAEPDVAVDLVLDLGDGSAYAAARGERLWGGIADGRLLLGCDPVASDRSEPADRALLEVLAAGEALWRILGREPHTYDFALRGPTLTGN